MKLTQFNIEYQLYCSNCYGIEYVDAETAMKVIADMEDFVNQHYELLETLRRDKTNWEFLFPFNQCPRCSMDNNYIYLKRNGDDLYNFFGIEYKQVLNKNKKELVNV